MSVASTSIKLAGLVFAMGLFGMGPGTILLDELKAKWEKKRENHFQSDDSIAAIVAPPGEEVPRKNTTRQHNPHLLEGTPHSPSPIRKHPTEGLAHDSSPDFAKHPFIPVNYPAQNLGKSASEDISVPKVPNTIPWLSFMMWTPEKSPEGQKRE
ncbi:hypothetical protein IV203_020678 [Nitzschia inconspicua]|uniref:Uncharacterized protein n=1 Tax=Nitzschia inconspicua TaxID=303405 RepID=A0A9K3PFA9_9STRA|nr:hypothetical protein IV203_020678 [Nitzschia inconspicua]